MKKSTLLASLVSAGVLAALHVSPQAALADDCLLDRDNDGNVDAGSTDNDGGANSNDSDSSTACGVGATATGSFSTALGSAAVASATRTVAVGRLTGSGCFDT